MDGFLEWFAQLLNAMRWWGIGEPILVYGVDFTTGHIDNKIDAPRLWVGTTQNPGQNPVPQAGPLSLGSGGLLLSITKSATDTRAAVMVALSPKPASLRRFRMVANYSLPEGLAPSDAGNQWAATLIARDGDKSELTDATVVMGATHQVRGGVPEIALGVAGATTSSGPQPIAAPLVYPRGLPREFQLQTDMDCDAGRGRSRMYTPDPQIEWRERSWTPPVGFDMRTAITAIGVGVGFTAQSSGRPTVLVKDFAIYKYLTQPWWRRAVSTVAGLAGVALSIAMRRRTEGGAVIRNGVVHDGRRESCEHHAAGEAITG